MVWCGLATSSGWADAVEAAATFGCDGFEHLNFFK